MSDRAIKVGDKDYELKLTLRSLRIIGEKLGLKIRPGHIDEDIMEQTLDLSVFGVVLWACLQHYKDDAPSLEDVEESVDQDNFSGVAESFFALFGATAKAKEMAASFRATLGQETETENETPAMIAG